MNRRPVQDVPASRLMAAGMDSKLKKKIIDNIEKEKQVETLDRFPPSVCAHCNVSTVYHVYSP